jgi:hypothetical protein
MALADASSAVQCDVLPPRGDDDAASLGVLVLLEGKELWPYLIPLLLGRGCPAGAARSPTRRSRMHRGAMSLSQPLARLAVISTVPIVWGFEPVVDQIACMRLYS